MNRLQSLRTDTEFCVTLNRSDAIDPDKVIRTIPYAHPVYTVEGQAAQARHHEISGQNRTHYCGAYWGWGFHEDGVKSGERVRGGAAVSQSAIYEGHIRHRRFSVRNHEFRYRLAMAYVDLDELPELLGGRLVRGRPGSRPLPPRGLPRRPEDPPRRDRASKSGSRAGPPAHRPDPPPHEPALVRPLLQPGELLLLLRPRRRPASTRWSPRSPTRRGASATPTSPTAGTGEFDKALHVSPFMAMGQRYTWRATTPGETLSVHIESSEDGRRAFDATLSLKRKPLTRRTLARQPGSALRTLALIYAHAVALKLKGVPVQPHPVR